MKVAGVSMSEYIGHRGLPGELKHLSSLRKRKKILRLAKEHSLSSGERNGNSPKSPLLRIGKTKLKLIFGNWKEEEKNKKMTFEEELRRLNKWKQSKEILEIADKTRGIFGGIIKEVEEDFIEYIGVQKIGGEGTDEYGYSLVPSGNIIFADMNPLKPIKTLIVNISIKEISEEEKMRIETYLRTAEKKAEKKEKKRR